MNKLTTLISWLWNSPIGKNFIANLFRVVVLFTNQILLVPLYLIYWGTEVYSDWIILSAVTTFFTMSDLGLNNVTCNMFCICYAQNNTEKCQSLLFNNYFLVITLGFIITIFVFLSGYIFDYNRLLGLHSISSNEASYILTLLIAQVFLGMLCTIPDAIYNANHLASKAIYLNNGYKLICSVIILIGILIDLSVSTIVTLNLLPPLLLLLYKYTNTQKLFHNNTDKQNFDYKLLKDIIKPSLYYMSFPFGNMIIFQCFTLLVNSFFGDSVLILFNTTRSLVNFIRTIIQTITAAVKPEFSLAYGRMDYQYMQKIYHHILLICFLLSIGICIFLLIFGPSIYNFWTSGKINFEYSLMIALFLSMIFNSIWEASGAVLMSTNNHIGLGKVYIISSILSLILAIIVSYNCPKLYYIALCLGVTDIFMAIYSVRKAFEVTLDKCLLKQL